nr:putative high light inducible protein [uncultured Mediterranean phage uvMED]
MTDGSPFLYNVTQVNKTSMTVTTEDGGRTNLFAREPQMYVSQTDAERYGYETYAERAEKLNGRTAMLGFVAALVSYATTGSLFFFGAFGI